MQENLIEHLNQSLLQNNIQFWITYLSKYHQIDSNYLKSQIWQIFNDIMTKMGKPFDLDLLKKHPPLLFNELGESPAILSKYLTPTSNINQ
jgi:hypothetical protein